MASLFRKAGSFAQVSPDDEDSDSGFGSLFKKKIAPPIPVQDALQQPTSQQTEALQSNAPQIDSGGLGSLSAPSPQKKNGILDKIKGFLGPHPEPIEKDEFGIEKPHAQSHSRLSNILGIALPALFGLTSGVGIAPALLSGFSGQQGRKNRELALDTKRYEQDRQAKELGLRPTSLQKDYQAYVQQETAAGREPKSLFEYQIANKNAGALQINPLDQSKADEIKRHNEALEELERIKIKTAGDKKNAGEKLPAPQSVLLAEGKSIPKILDDLEKTLNENKDIGGPIAGRINALNPLSGYSTKTQNVQSQIDASKQLIGKFLEGGVLRKEDESKYDKILPTLNDTVAVRSQKIKGLRNLIQSKYNGYLESFANSGYDVSKYERLGEPQARPRPADSQPSPAGPGPRQPLAQSNDARRQARINFIRSNPNHPLAKEYLQGDPSLGEGL